MSFITLSFIVFLLFSLSVYFLKKKFCYLALILSFLLSLYLFFVDKSIGINAISITILSCFSFGIFIAVFFEKQWITLLLLNCMFYLYSSPVYFLFVLFSTLVSFFGALFIGKCSRRWSKTLLFIPSLLLLLCPLVISKYTNFLIASFNKISGTQHPSLNLIVPLGISFFTFQTVSYLADVFLGKGSICRNPFKYFLFVSFFPTIIMGPLSKYSEVSSRLLANHVFGTDRFVNGIKRVVFGAFKKVVIADSLISFTDLVFNGISSFYGFTIVLAVLAYAILIYCDFSGYMDIAIGVSYIFGVDLPENFDEPYLSPTISDFWRRWHITLGRWLRDYIYIPLGGSKKGVLRKGLNVFIVFVVSGIWHGASWHFVLWGLYFGVLSMLSVYLQKPFQKMKSNLRINDSSTIWRIWQITRTFFLVCVGWLLFRSNSVYSVWVAIKHFFDFGRDTLFSSNSPIGLKSFILVTMGCVVAFLAKSQFNYKTSHQARFSIVLADDYSQIFYHTCLLVVMCLLMFVVANSSISQASNFTYFNF